MQKLELLGKATIFHEDTWQSIPNDKRGALLVYLALQGDWVSRDELAFVFWPDNDTKTAKANLRQVLRRTKSLAYAEMIETEGAKLRLACRTDVENFKKLNESADVVAATESYKGHLLQGFNVPDAEGFNSWLELERSELQELWQSSLKQCAEELAKTDRHVEAAKLIKQVWQLDAFDEEMLQRYMRQAALAGNKASALKVYEDFKVLLEADVGLEPVEATQQLAEAIEQDNLSAEDSSTTSESFLPASISATTFVGREADIQEVKTALQGKQQIFALLGLGGIGKSRLALELAQDLITEFEYGVVFVPLASSTSDTLLSTIAEALSFRFYGNQDPKTQLTDYLRKKEMLLILDNFEHLTEQVDSLVDIATEAPKLKLLITSREKPEVPNLWTKQLDGLLHTQTDSPAQQLFLDAAKLHTPNFVVDDSEQEGIQELCQVVEGLPLALELAAAWVSELSIENILNDIKQNLSTLKSGDSSIEAVLEHSWSLLSPEQQSTLAKLSVFSGGFTKSAAQEVTDASNYLTLSLLNRSLLRQQGNRFDMHEMIRQFAIRKLKDLDCSTDIFVKHTAFYLKHVSDQAENIKTQKQIQALNEIQVELDNVRTAWNFELENPSKLDVEVIDTLGIYYIVRCLFFEAETIFGLGNEHLQNQDLKEHCKYWQGYAVYRQHRYDDSLAILTTLLDSPLKARAQKIMGLALANQQKYDAAFTVLEEAQEHFEQTKQTWELADTLNFIATAYGQQSKYPQALDYGKQALELSKVAPDSWQYGQVLTKLGVFYKEMGNFDEALILQKEALLLNEALENQEGQAGCLLNLASTMSRQGNYVEGEALLQKSIDIFGDIGIRKLEAQAISNMAMTYFFTGRVDDAINTFEEVCTIAEELNDDLMLANGYQNLAKIALTKREVESIKDLAQKSIDLFKKIDNPEGIGNGYELLASIDQFGKNWAAAWLHQQSALKIYHEINVVPRLLAMTANFAAIYNELGFQDKAISIFKLVVEHPAGTVNLKEQLKKAINELEVDISQYETQDLEAVVQELLSAKFPG